MDNQDLPRDRVDTIEVRCFARAVVADQSVALRVSPFSLIAVAAAASPSRIVKRERSIEQIAALPVGDLAHDDCILWLWTTNFNMREALGLVEHWGFQHKTLLTWVKDRFGYGDWLRTQTEHVIFATRGRPIVQLTNESTVLFAPMRAHSEKPDQFYALVEKLCPAPRYCELSRGAGARTGTDTAMNIVPVRRRNDWPRS
jgi:N6-adenosine-specific RNA methylase IME4